MPHSILSEYDAKRLFFGSSRARVFYAYKTRMGDLVTNLDAAETVACTDTKEEVDPDRERYVIKVDQQIKGRGKRGLVQIGLTRSECMAWTRTVPYERFIIEPVRPCDGKERYFCMVRTMKNHRPYVTALYGAKGGVDVGTMEEEEDVSGSVGERSMKTLPVSTLVRESKPLGEPWTVEDFKAMVQRAQQAPEAPGSSDSVERSDPVEPALLEQMVYLHAMYVRYHLVMLETNPLARMKDGSYEPLDFAVQYDDTATFLWDYEVAALPDMEGAGSSETKEEAAIRALDATTGGSLKFKLLNPNGTVWTMVAGGGASVAYMDAILGRGYVQDLANYGEYSGNPPDELLYQYACNIFSLMAKSRGTGTYHLFIGGGIANFTDVDKTFQGILRAIRSYNSSLFQAKDVRIWVRRAGPNYEKAMQRMEELRQELGLAVRVFGVDKELTFPVREALPARSSHNNNNASATLAPRKTTEIDSLVSQLDVQFQRTPPVMSSLSPSEDAKEARVDTGIRKKCFIYGAQTGVVQNMLDFDALTGKFIDHISVAGMLDWTRSETTQVPIYFGNREILVPVYATLAEAVEEHPDANGVINYASFRSAAGITEELLECPSIHWVYVIAEGVPEATAVLLGEKARRMGKTIVGPSSVGAIYPGFRVGNAGGSIDNVLRSRLHKTGSIGLVSKSGGLLNELASVCSQNGDGIHTAIAIGGDTFGCTSFLDVLLQYEKEPQIKLMVMLGEAGGTWENTIAYYKRAGLLTKPIIALSLGESASYLTQAISFGHAGSYCSSPFEAAAFKNRYMEHCGILVPESFDEFGRLIREQCARLGCAASAQDLDESAAIRGSTVVFQRKGRTKFFCSISNESGKELTYNGIEISQTAPRVGNAIGLLWFKRELPEYFMGFIEKALFLVADHGPGVSGAINTITSTRAGKDLVTSLCSGLATIGPRFGGAIAECARQVYDAQVRQHWTADEFVKVMGQRHTLLSGFGHRIKTKENPDQRVVLLERFVRESFPKNVDATRFIDYGRSVEAVLLRKRNNLILNVDGFIACAFLDAMHACGLFSTGAIESILSSDVLNGLFCVGRSIGLVGHHLDQLRLKQPLFRLGADDVSYLS